MQLNIAAEHVINIADIMEEYILEEVKEKSSDFEAVNALCSFYRKLKEAASSVQENETDVILIADEVVQKVFPDTIEKHIKDIVKDADNLDLISEITAIYNCMKNDIPMSSSSAKNNTGKQSKYKKNSGGKSEDNRTSQMDVKDAQYSGENTQATNDKSGGAANNNKQQAAAGAATGTNNNTASNTGQAANTTSNASNTTANTDGVKNPQWAYDDDVLY